MKTEIKVFSHEEFGQLRTMTMPDGQVGFVGKDVAMVLGYERPDNAIRNHVDDEDKLMHQISASGQRRNVWFINESGLYSLILSSKLTKAREFIHSLLDSHVNVMAEELTMSKSVEGPIPKNGAYLYWNQLGALLKSWRANHVSDAHATKLLRLYVGYEFRDLMDEYGRYPRQYFNEIRRRLGFKHVPDLFSMLQTSQSFALVGPSKDKIMAIFSPIWHQYEAADGLLLPGSYLPGTSRKCDRKCDDIINLNNNILSVGKAEALTLDRDARVRSQMVRDFSTRSF